MSLPCPHFSWSQLYTYETDPAEYFTRYVLGAKPPATEPMRFGSIAHEAFAIPDFDYEEAIRKEGMTPDKARYIRRALSDPLLDPKTPGIEREKLVEAPFGLFKGPEGKPMKLLGYFDGYHPKRVVFEWKTGKTPWSKEKVDEHGQLTFYALLCRMALGGLPKEMILKHIGTNGRVKTYQTARTDEEVDAFVAHRLIPAMEAIDKEIFNPNTEKRIWA